MMMMVMMMMHCFVFLLPVFFGGYFLLGSDFFSASLLSMLLLRLVFFALPQSFGPRIDGNVAGIHEGRARGGRHGFVHQDSRRNTGQSHGDQNGPKKKKSATKDCGPGRGGGVQDATEGCEKKKSRQKEKERWPPQKKKKKKRERGYPLKYLYSCATRS